MSERCACADDRDFCASANRDLATQEWDHTNAYADARSEVICAITARAEA